MPTADRLRPTPFIAGLAGAVAVMFVGVWLLIAPFAVGYQPDGADWVDGTIVGVATGAAVLLLGLLTLVVVAGALRAEVRRRGLAPTVRSSPTDGDAGVDGDDDQQLPIQAGDLETVLASLAAALLEDVRDGHHDPTPDGIRPSRAATSRPPAAQPECR
jgi:hypothetical protein